MTANNAWRLKDVWYRCAKCSYETRRLRKDGTISKHKPPDSFFELRALSSTTCRGSHCAPRQQQEGTTCDD